MFQGEVRWIYPPTLAVGGAGTFNNAVDGAGCKLLLMDHHRTVATGWPVTELLEFQREGRFSPAQ